MLPVWFSNGYAFYDYFDQILYNVDDDVVVPVQNGKLLSQGKMATAQTASETKPASYANDGSYQTEWTATSSSWPHWRTVGDSPFIHFD
ncbi:MULTISPECIES: hypothetical protein [Paenibacillus]|uniref:hypothetical protein n=1 Tax=Paenibacillus TaxID=44249 RepID=UPI002FE0E18C